MTLSHEISTWSSINLLLVLRPYLKHLQERKNFLKWKRRQNLVKKMMTGMSVWEKKLYWYGFRFHIVNYGQFIIEFARLNSREAWRSLRESGRPGEGTQWKAIVQKKSWRRKTNLSLHQVKLLIWRYNSFCFSDPLPFSLLFLPFFSSRIWGLSLLRKRIIVSPQFDCFVHPSTNYFYICRYNEDNSAPIKCFLYF